MTDCVVYWLHDETCICLQRHGYVGISTDWTRRLAQHQRNKRFPANFEWSIIYTGSRAECLKLEHQLRPEPGVGWNRAQGGKPVIEFTPEVRARMREARVGKKASPETLEKMRIASTGRTNLSRTAMPHTEATKAKMSAVRRGEVRSPEARKNISAALMGRPAGHTRPHSEMTKLVLSLKKAGVPIHSDEHKRALSERMKGNTYTKGKPWSPARRAAHHPRLKEGD